MSKPAISFEEFRGSLVLVPCGAGLIGSNVVERLLELGARVRAPDDPGRIHETCAAGTRLGYEVKVSLSEGIRRTADWLRSRG